jgi:replication factor A1
MDGGWFCERCNTQHPRCAHRYIISLTASDYTGTTWLTVFNEQGEMLLGGTKADYLQEMRGSGVQIPCLNACS